MEYGFLYDKASRLLSIGYNVDERRRDASYYDLLASEARLSVFVAIAQGQLPQESWFALGRLLTSAGGEPILLSWSGSMFEYLMPQLVMPTYEHTLLDQTAKAAVARQIEYGQQRGVPWGISESGYNTVDVASQLPVPRLRRARPGAEARARRGPGRRALRLGARADGGAGGGLPEPATALRRRGARPVRLSRGHRLHPGTATARRIPRPGALLHGPSPGHEPARPGLSAAGPPDAAALRIRPAVPGHPAAAAGADPQGLGVLCPHRRAHRHPGRRGQPADADTRARQSRHAGPGSAAAVQRPLSRHGHQRRRRLQPLEGSRRDALARRRHPRPLGHLLLPARPGQRRGLDHRAPAHLQRAESYEAIFSEGRAEFRRRDGDFDTHTEIVVSPEDDIELRRVRITNRSTARRTHRGHELRGGGAGGARRRRRCIRRSAICSCRPRSSRRARPSSAPAGPARATSRRPGCFT